MSLRNSVLAALSIVILAGCGGGKSASNEAASNQQNDRTSAPMAGMPNSTPMREASGAVAPVPATLHCGSAAPVWVNLRTRAYHEAGDPYYGRSKHGEYLCADQAVAQGFHKAGSMKGHRHRQGGAMNGAGAGDATGNGGAMDEATPTP